jgi:NDP-sugar pyrophosphorylase family protein
VQAIILAGGKGTRLRPYTTTFPKPLMPIDDLPILEIVLRQLARAGFDRIIMTTGHLAEMIRLFCGDGSKWGVHIEYTFEDRPLGTAGPIALLTDKVDDNFLVMNGDLLTTMDYRRSFNTHVTSGINFFRRGVLRHLEPGKPLDIPELILRLRAAGERVACLRQDCYWLDIGRAEDYQIATEEFLKHRHEFLPSDD